MNVNHLIDVPPWDWPDDTDALLLEKLGDESAAIEDRLLAAEMAGNLAVTNEELVEALLALVENAGAPESLRGQAAISLGPVLEDADSQGFDEFSDVPISEATFHRIRECLQQLYGDAAVPKYVRRRILEASVRAPRDWHSDAIRAAYSRDDRDWKLTAVFAMGCIRGFDDQIVEALDSKDEEIRCEAIHAAGEWEVSAAWSRVRRIVTSKSADKALLLAAIDAVASIRPEEAGEILVELTNSDDEEIEEAALEAMMLAEAATGEDFEEDDEDDDGF